MPRRSRGNPLLRARQSYYNDHVFALWNGKELQVVKENAILAPKEKEGNVGRFDVTFKRVGQISGAQLKKTTEVTSLRVAKISSSITMYPQALLCTHRLCYVHTGFAMRFDHMVFGLGHWFKSHLPRRPLGL